MDSAQGLSESSPGLPKQKSNKSGMFNRSDSRESPVKIATSVVPKKSQHSHPLVKKDSILVSNTVLPVVPDEDSPNTFTKMNAHYGSGGNSASIGRGNQTSKPERKRSSMVQSTITVTKTTVKAQEMIGIMVKKGSQTPLAHLQFQQMSFTSARKVPVPQLPPQSNTADPHRPSEP